MSTSVHPVSREAVTPPFFEVPVLRTPPAPHPWSHVLILLLTGLIPAWPAAAQHVDLLGESVLWHKVTLRLTGPDTSEEAEPNPFTERRFDVAFEHPATGTRLVVPGFFAADGDAAETGATAGDKWHCHFRPNHPGTWNYRIGFRQGANVAMSKGGGSGKALAPFDGVTGSFQVSADNPAVAPDLRAKGRLRHVDKHHLKFAGNGAYFLKYGPDLRENFLAFEGFDNTPAEGRKGGRHTFTAHAKHYRGDGRTWRDGRGKNILGAVNYLASTRANAIAMLLNNTGPLEENPDNPKPPFADLGAQTFPYTSGAERLRFDCSKLEQWEIVFDHIEQKGLCLHFKLDDLENARNLDSGNGSIGSERKIYYREMVARFGHHLALSWGLSDHPPVDVRTQTAWVAYLAEIDPWQNHRVFHTAPSQDKDKLYQPHLGDSALTGVSLQTPEATETQNVFAETKRWVDASAQSGHRRVVACNPQGPSHRDVNHSFALIRKNVVWGNLMAGGAGAEFYAGDVGLMLDDHAPLLMWSGYAVHDFFGALDIPFWDMRNADALVSNETAHCLTDSHDTFVVYLREGGTTKLDLREANGTFAVGWFDPRNGGTLQTGSVNQVAGGGLCDLGAAPSQHVEDWVVLIARTSDDLHYGAADGFDILAPEDGRTTYMAPKQGKVLAINAANPTTHGKFARAERTFSGAAGRYNVQITTLTEFDGESVYRLLVNGTVVGEFKNPRVDKTGDFKPHPHTWPGIALRPGDSLAIESAVDSNGLIPEGNGFAFSRGRWQQLDLVFAGPIE